MCDYTDFLNPDSIREVRDFIVSHWQETVRHFPEDKGTLVGLPYPYTVPSRQGTFQELYYWDTYFTCLGLIESGRIDLAVFNTKNLLSQVERFGFVPNGNRTYYLTRSQPPYLAALVKRIAECPGDLVPLPEALLVLRREYEFWTRRATPAGLARYGHHATRDQLLALYAELAPRTGLTDDPERVLPELSHFLAECESGWDFNPRFHSRCDEFYAVDLNCLLHGYERLFADDPAMSAENNWSRLAAERIAKLNEFCWDEERGGFFDFDFVRQRRSGVASCASFQTLWAGIASEDQGQPMVEKFLPQLEFPFGVAACGMRADNRRCQWDYPNGWPCQQHIIVTGLARYGYSEAARRVAQKYLATVCRSFEETGDLWEKYNVEDGTPRTFTEPGYINTELYGGEPLGVKEDGVDRPPAMMGWTAGVFMTLLPWAS